MTMLGSSLIQPQPAIAMIFKARVAEAGGRGAGTRVHPVEPVVEHCRGVYSFQSIADAAGVNIIFKSRAAGVYILFKVLLMQQGSIFFSKAKYC